MLEEVFLRDQDVNIQEEQSAVHWWFVHRISSLNSQGELCHHSWAHMGGQLFHCLMGLYGFLQVAVPVWTILGLWSMIVILCKTPLEKNGFLFASVYQLQIISWLGMIPQVNFHLSIHARILIGFIFSVNSSGCLWPFVQKKFPYPSSWIKFQTD